MKVNLLVLILFILFILTLITFLIIRNQKDKKDLKYRINKDYPKPPHGLHKEESEQTL